MEGFEGVSEKEVDVLVLRLYRGVRNVPFAQYREYALAVIKPVLDFDAAKWGMGIHDGSGTYISSIHLHQFPPEILDDYANARGGG
jgi:hypothetical protein